MMATKIKADAPIADNARNLTSSNASSFDQFSETLGRTLNTALKNLPDVKKEEKGIMDTFAARKANAKTQGEAERQLTSTIYGGKIEDSAAATAQSFNLEQEARRGFATNTALMREITDTGSKRIRELSRDRDSLLLQSKYSEAGRMDSLIADEQTAITNARKSWLDSFLQLTSAAQSAAAEERARRSFETPEQKRQADAKVARETAEADFNRTVRSSVMNLQSLAPDANILSTDSYDTAVAKYRGSQSYLRNVSKSEKELKAIDANIAQSYASVNASNASAAASRAAANKTDAETRALSSPTDPSSPQSPQNILNALVELKNHPGKSMAVGVSGLANILPGTPGASFKDKFKTVQSLLALPNLGLLKGAMSDSDRDFIIRAGTSLNTTNSPKDFDKTLDELIAKYQKGVEKQNQLLGISAAPAAPATGGYSYVVPQGNLFGSLFTPVPLK